MVLRHFERDGLWSRLNGLGRWWHHKFVVQNGIQAFAKLSVQNALHCISENFNLKNFPGEACFRNSLENCAVRSPGGRYRAHIATLYHISRPLYHNILRPPEIQYQWTCYCVWDMSKKCHFYQYKKTERSNCFNRLLIISYPMSEQARVVAAFKNVLVEFELLYNA